MELSGEENKDFMLRVRVPMSMVSLLDEYAEKNNTKRSKVIRALIKSLENEGGSKL